MDPVCHTLTGAAFGQVGLARRSRFGLATLMIAANLPDIDVGVLATHTLAVSFRRGWTHGILGQAVLPPLLVGLVLAWSRLQPASERDAGPPVRAGWLLVMVYLGVLSHVGLDFLNTYGVRLLMPYSDRWFYGDALFIVDPWMLAFLGSGVWLTRQRRLRHHEDESQPIRRGLVLAGVYIALMLTANALARDAVRAGIERAGQQPDTRFMVTPVFGNPLYREVVIDLGDHYEKGTVWFTPMPHFRPGGFGIEVGLDDPVVQPTLVTPEARGFLSWSRFPFATVDPSRTPSRVWLNDYRYSNTGPGGWSALPIEPEAR